MIIKAARIATSSGAGAVAAHVLRGPQNEAITLLQGSEDQLRDAVRDAAAHGSKYSLRHYKISPGEAATPDDVRGIVSDLGREFGFNPELATIVWHQKARAGGAGFDHHAHALVPEYDPGRNRVLDWHHSYARHEKIARLAEDRLGHTHTAGRHNAAVAHALTAEGNGTLVATVGALAQPPRPNSGYRTETHQRAERQGRNQPADRLAVREAWERSDSPRAFTAALAERGISVRAGEKRGVWIAEREGELVGAVHRLAGADRTEVARRLDGADIRTVAEFQPSDPPPSAASAITTQESRTTAAHGQPSAATGTAAVAAQQTVPSRDAPPSAATPISAGGGNGTAAAQSAPVHDSHGGDPTAGIEIPAAGDILGQIRYREQVARRAAQIAEAAARRAPQPKQESGGGNRVSSTEISVGGDANRAATEAVRRFLDELNRAFTRGRAEAEIRAAVAQFTADCSGIERDYAAAGGDRPTIGRNDSADAHEHSRGPESAGRPDQPAAERGSEPDNRNPELLDASVGEPAPNRTAEREDIARRATARRFELGIAAQPETLQRLRQATAALTPDPFADLTGRARAEALASARTGLHERYRAERETAAEAEKLRWKNTLAAQQAAAERLAATVKSGGRAATRTGKTVAFDTMKQARQHTVERLKQTAPSQDSFEDWLQRQSLTDPAARPIYQHTTEQRQRREQVAGRISADQEAIARVLATNPHTDPADRDPQVRANAYAHRISEGLRERQAAAEAAARAAAEARAGRTAGTRLLSVLGITTRAQRRADDLQRQAHDLAETARRQQPTRYDYRHARATGEAFAYAAQRTVQAWQERPDVATALENARLNALAQAVAAAGDRDVAAALGAGDPEAARSIIRAREQHREQQHRLAEETRNNGPRGSNNSGPAGPRRR